MLPRTLESARWPRIVLIGNIGAFLLLVGILLRQGTVSAALCTSSTLPLGWTKDLLKHEHKVFSQFGEDGIIEEIFKNIGTTNKYYVEFGTEDGSECNTRRLRESGWSGLLMDGGFENEAINQHREWISPATITPLFDKYSVPEEFDLLSIDINYDDYYVWQNISVRYRPRVVVVEYNGGIPAEKRWTVDPADPQRWTNTDYYGASLRAFADLGRRKGYCLVAAGSAGVNAFFVRADLLAAQGVAAPPLLDVYVHRHWHAPNTDRSREWVVLDGEGAQVGRLYHDISTVVN